MASRRGKTTRGADTPRTGEPTDAEGVAEPGASPDVEGASRPEEPIAAETPEPAENMFAEEARPDPVTATPDEEDHSGASTVEPDAVTPEPAAETIDETELTDLAEAETHVEAADQPRREGEQALAETVPEVPSEPEASQSQSVPPAAEPRRSGGFLAPLLGGVLAAVLGYGLAIYGWTQNLALPFLPQADSGADAALGDLRAEISAEAEARAAEIAALEAELEALRGAPGEDGDTTVLEERLAEIEARIADPAVAGSADALAALEDRLAALEARPVAEGSDVDAGELSALREQVSAVQSEVDRLSTEAAEETAAARAAAEAAEEELAARAAEAEAIASSSAARAALAQLSAALESGAPLSPGVEALESAGVAVPPALDAARDGVPTLAALQQSYPEAARAALSEAMAADEAPDAPLDRFGSFLRSQVALRSLSPREGDDADAILSRAEAALRAGDLTTAVAEIETLPEAAQAPLSEWQTQARNRLAAVEAVQTVSTEIDPQ